MLSVWFVACFCGSSFNHIIPPTLVLDCRMEAVNILLPKHHVPPDPEWIIKLAMDNVEDPPDLWFHIIEPPNPIHQINQTLTCEVNQQSIKHKGSLIDCGANGSIVGDDVQILDVDTPPWTVNVCCINNHKLTNISIVSCPGVVTSQKGHLTLIMNQRGKGHFIHASPQLEQHDNIVDNKVLVNMTNNTWLQSMDMWFLLLFVMDWVTWTCISQLMLSSMKGLISCLNLFWCLIWSGFLAVLALHPTAVLILTLFLMLRSFNATHPSMMVGSAFTILPLLLSVIQPIHAMIWRWLSSLIHLNSSALLKKVVKPKHHQLTALNSKPNLVGTWQKQSSTLLTTQCNSTNMFIPAICRRCVSHSILLAMFQKEMNPLWPTLCFITPKPLKMVNNSSHRKSLFISCLTSSATKVLQPNLSVTLSEISNKTKDILCCLHILKQQFESHHQHQNPCEHCHCGIKPMANPLLDRTNSPPEFWLLCLQYVCHLLNHTPSLALQH